MGIGAAHARQNPTQPSQQAPAQTAEQVIDAKLGKVERISVDSFGDDSVAKQLQAMIINALADTKRFIIVDQPGNNPDAILRGAALATTTGGSKPQGGAAGVGNGGGLGSAGSEADAPQEGGPSSASGEADAPQKKGGAGSTTGGADDSKKGAPASAGGEADVPQKSGQDSGKGGADTPQKGGSSSIASSDTVIDVSVAVRLVATDGIVIWTATKESKGAKGKGPIEDAANMIVTQLLSDLAKIPPPAKQ
jgi:hypothetical protein